MLYSVTTHIFRDSLKQSIANLHYYHHFGNRYLKAGIYKYLPKNLKAFWVPIRLEITRILMTKNDWISDEKLQEMLQLYIRYDHLEIYQVIYQSSDLFFKYTEN